MNKPTCFSFHACHLYSPDEEDLDLFELDHLDSWILWGTAINLSGIGLDDTTFTSSVQTTYPPE
jgi:hypothetical protein